VELPQYYRPAGFDSQDVVLKLNKSIYGQVDSPKLFYEHLCKGMDALGFEPSEADPCLFIHREHKIMVLNYCDDQIWLSPDDKLIEDYVGKLKGLGYYLTLEPEGDIFAFLGISFSRLASPLELTPMGNHSTKNGAGATPTLLDYGDMKTIRTLLASSPELDSPSLSSTAPLFGLENYKLASR